MRGALISALLPQHCYHCTRHTAILSVTEAGLHTFPGPATTDTRRYPYRLVFTILAWFNATRDMCVLYCRTYMYRDWYRLANTRLRVPSGSRSHSYPREHRRDHTLHFFFPRSSPTPRNRVAWCAASALPARRAALNLRDPVRAPAAAPRRTNAPRAPRRHSHSGSRRVNMSRGQLATRDS